MQSQETPKNETESYAVFKLQDFEGPLDLLLFLIRRSEINIYDIPIHEITEQYLEYLRTGERADLENLTEFYVMAATLLHIKSRMLLPNDAELGDELEDPRAELVERLIEYQKYKKLTDIMIEREKHSEWVLDRKKKEIALPFPEEDDVWEQMDVWDLFKAFSAILETVSDDRIIDLYEEVSINEKITLINELLDRNEQFPFTDLIVRPDSRMEIVCALLAILETVKSRRVRIFQNRLFGDIMVRRGPGEVLDGPE